MANFICSDCIKDVFLKRYVRENGVAGCCAKCNREKQWVVPVGDKEFQNRFKASFRYYYSEILYNPHWGGASGWIDLLGEPDNKIFTEPLIEPEAVDSDIYYDFSEIEGYATDSDTGVSLYYGGGRRDVFLAPIARERWMEMDELERNIDYNNPDIIRKTIVEKIRGHIQPLMKEIKNVDLYRARIGVKDVLHYAELGDEPEDVYIPYKRDEINAPWPKDATEGRFNRRGTAYLYMSSDMETAINEIRPSVGHHISVGRFRIEKKIRIVDFTDIDFYDYAVSDARIEEYIKLKSIERILSIRNPDKNYRLTQGFSDAFIEVGCEGVKFHSSVTKGTYNVVLFNRGDAQYVEGSHVALYINGLQYDVVEENHEINRDRLRKYVSERNTGKERDIILENFVMDIDAE